MNDTTVEGIWLTEKETEESVLASKTKSRKISGQAKEEAGSLYKELTDQTRDLEKKEVQNMKKQAQGDSQNLLIKTDSQAERLEKMKKQDYPELMKLIVEKVMV